MAAIAAVMLFRTPAVSQVGCVPAGGAGYTQRKQAVRPGITGWAQINYKYGDTLEDTITKLEYDIYYIKNMSMALDTYIIFHTLKAMLL